jgi:hypothetical protein
MPSLPTRFLCLALLSWIIAGVSIAKAKNPSNVGSRNRVTRVGNIANQTLIELSGLAYSRINSNVLWAINDGGTPPFLFAIGSNGADLGSFYIDGSHNNDWEDLASFKWDNTAFLLIADVGDNFRQRKSCTLYIVEEPVISGTRLKTNPPVKVAYQIQFIYEDGPRDCEAVAVDTKHRKILLLTKRTSPALLYSLPLELGNKESIQIAKRTMAISNVLKPTAMDISSRAKTAAVLTYNHAYLFTRHCSEDWSEAFLRKPRILKFPVLFQQEAICFNNSSLSVYISSEGQSAPLLRIDLDANSSR